ncbi:MAG: hypothetical protein BA863_08060 [Desulfovibrio sp. S3730MH75]|nr:MAG: hypothetical protein BA863_08060 [Desulfovibrio sp. S3730MH75]
MRTTFILCFVCNLILAIVSVFVSPSNVAIHFGLGGQSDGWAPAYVSALIMTGVNTLLFLSLLFSPQLIRKTPAKWINFPNKDYWLKDENRSKTESLLSGQIFLFGTVTFVFMFIVGLLALQANLSDPIRFREDIFWWPFGLFMMYTVFWTINIMKTFRIPKQELC